MSGLTITGRVEHRLLLRFADLAALAGQIDDVGTMVPGRKGGAVRLAAVLSRADVQAGATHAVLISRDGAFTATVALADIAGALLVYRLNGGPLPEADGGPVRFLNPEAMECEPGNKKACANVKHLGAIEIVAPAPIVVVAAPARAP